MTPSCKGEKFGHQFEYTGANCLACGVNQTELSGGGLRRAAPVTANPFDLARFRTPAKPALGIHSEVHALVDEIRKSFGETSKKGIGSFGYYLGFFTRIGVVRIRQLYAESKDAADPKKAFWWRIGDMSRKQKEM